LAVPLNSLKNYQNALRFADERLKAELESYCQQASNRPKANTYDAACAMLNQGGAENIRTALSKFESIPDWEDSQEKIRQCKEKLEQIRTEQASAELSPVPKIIKMQPPENVPYGVHGEA
jgi:hypothetical protein